MFVRLRVKEFGPIRNGFESDDGLLSIKKVTLFCGPQGSGKSSIAKLLSTLSWLEKCVVKDPSLAITEDLLVQALSWQGIDEYLRNSTEIEYRGHCLHLTYSAGHIGVSCVFGAEKYEIPKISYMPAERNFASIVKSANRVEGLPRSLVDMQVEFDKAKKFFQKGYKLPANGFRFQFDKDPWIVNGNGQDASRTRLECASSGLQSIVPLLLVSEYLSANLAQGAPQRSAGFFYDPGTAEKKQRIDQFVEAIRKSDLPDAQKMARLEDFFAPSRRFLNIVEEPEQNLYPETQCDVLNSLLRIANSRPLNQLVVSTHSPYLLNHMTLVAQAAYMRKKIDEDSVAARRIAEIVPQESLVSSDDMAIFETRMDGSVVQVEMVDGLPSDRNPLNTYLGEFNERFARLLEAAEQ